MNREQRRQAERMATRQRAMRRVQRPVRRPMTGKLRDQILLDLHVSLETLRIAPTDDARTDLASSFNTVGVAIQNDKRFVEEVSHLNAGAAVLQDYVAPAALTDDQFAILAHTAAVIDTILSLIDVETLWVAEKVAVAAVRQMRAAA